MLYNNTFPVGYAKIVLNKKMNILTQITAVDWREYILNEFIP